MKFKNFPSDLNLSDACPACQSGNNRAVFSGKCLDCGGNSGDGGYCYSCGGSNIESNRYCEDCGNIFNPDAILWNYMEKEEPQAAGLAIVCGGYIVFETINEHDTWLKQA